ncbi:MULTISPECIES: hypothetical protein [Dolichospermum]|uniref:Uncharacterized protein n=1 Tax=Dolichospermum heterosporum TAC447 TaxID=747523 RepID=A0ABY5LW71_9CYAN|nr:MULTISPECIES: hypothetical protein [Dolichospermum]MBE9258543.1 hypothetical protein [Dolichospermum sp. LEGE 00246]UUO15126.1 hypothetical protein NG743_24490 [Dolichospermum heterosporum TAC447]
MSNVKQTVYLITDRQRDGLIGYLQNCPYKEVAGAIQFLTSAPSAVLNVDVPEDQSATNNGESATPAASLELTSVA